MSTTAEGTFPAMRFALTPPQQELYDRATNAGLEYRNRVADWDRANVVPYSEIHARMGELGFYGLTMPPAYGGQNGTALDYLIAATALFRAAQTWVCCEPLFTTSGPGPSMLLVGDNEAVREKYLPAVVRGETDCAIALTEPGHGSDLTNLKTTVRREGDELVLNGAKNFLTGATVQNLYAVFARFDGVPGARGIGAVVVERDTPRVTLDAGPEFVGIRGIPHGEMTLTEARVPAENLIVGPGCFGQLMSAFNMERLHNCAFNLGLELAAYDEAVSYVSAKTAFNRPIIEFQAVYHALADMYATIQAHWLLSWRAAEGARDGRFPDQLDVSVANCSAPPTSAW
jgi:butyryl-CoA dehydrogenase